MAIEELDEFLVDLGAAFEHGVGLSFMGRLLRSTDNVVIRG